MQLSKLVVFTVLALLACSAVAQKNLVTNGGFEDDLYGWNGNSAKITPYDFKAGKNSCAIVAFALTEWTGIDQVIKIPKKVLALEFSAWLKAEHLLKGKNDWDGGQFTVQFLDASDKGIGNYVNVANLSDSQPWTLVQKNVKIPEGAVSFKIILALGNASGTMLIDDVSAKPIAPEEVAKQ